MLYCWPLLASSPYFSGLYSLARQNLFYKNKNRYSCDWLGDRKGVRPVKPVLQRLCSTWAEEEKQSGTSKSWFTWTWVIRVRFLPFLGRITCTEYTDLASCYWRSLACLVCLLDIITSCAKMAQSIQAPLGLWTWVGPRNNMSLGRSDPQVKGQFGECSFPPAMWPFVTIFDYFSFVAVAFSQLFSKYICVFVVLCRCSPPTVWFVEFWIWQNGLSVHPTFTFTTTCSTSATTSSIVSRCTVSCLRNPLVLIGYFLPTVFVEFRAFTAVMFLQFTVFCSSVFNDFQSHILCCVCRSFLRRLITSCTKCLNMLSHVLS